MAHGLTNLQEGVLRLVAQGATQSQLIGKLPGLTGAHEVAEVLRELRLLGCLSNRPGRTPVISAEGLHRLRETV